MQQTEHCRKPHWQKTSDLVEPIPNHVPTIQLLSERLRKHQEEGAKKRQRTRKSAVRLWLLKMTGMLHSYYLKSKAAEQNLNNDNTIDVLM